MKAKVVLSIAALNVISYFACASTIAEIAMLPEGGHATSDAVVILSVTDLVPDAGYKSFQVRDLTRAMTIYGTNAEIDAVLTGFGTGDIVGIEGYTAQVGGALVLTSGGSVAGFAVSGRTSTAPLLTNAVSVLPSDIAESFESNLVCLNNVSFLSEGTFAGESSYSLDGVYTIVRIATADLNLVGQSIPTGPVNITGIVLPNLEGDGYILAPRGIGDIVLVPEPATIVLLAAGAMVLPRRCR